MSSSTSSIVKVIDIIVEDKVNTTLPKTKNVVLLFKAGSNLTPTVLSQLSY